jgi:hypothetical protein
MSELQRIKIVEERITLAGLLPGVNLGSLPPEDAVMLKRAALNLYRIGHANGFKAGVDHATTAVAVVAAPRHDSLRTQRLTRRLTTRMCERWQEFKKSLGSIRVAVIIGPRGRPSPNEPLNGKLAIRR